MSSLAAARADSFYFPPEWRPEMGGLSKFHGSKGANQYQKYGIIRFELPFDGWCTKCKTHIGKGTRFNAKKNRAGNYFSTTIWSFTMKCYHCDNMLTIKTDPEKRTYNYADGIRPMEQDYDPDKNDSVIVPLSEDEKRRLSNDPIFKLQHENEDKVRSQSSREVISELVEVADLNHLNDYDANSMLRSSMRKGRKRRNELLQEGEGKGFTFPLQELTAEDMAAASKVKFKSDNFRKSEKQKFEKIRKQSLFSQDHKSSEIQAQSKRVVNSSSHKSSVPTSNHEKLSQSNGSRPKSSNIVLPKSLEHKQQKIASPAQCDALSLLSNYSDED